MAVCLFVPLLGGLYVRRLGKAEALTSIGGGMLVMLLVQMRTNGAGYGWVTPAMAGLAVAVVGGLVIFLRPRRASS